MPDSRSGNEPAIGWTLSALGLLLSAGLFILAIQRFVWGPLIVSVPAFLGALGVAVLSLYLVFLRVRRMRTSTGRFAGHWGLALTGIVLPISGGVWLDVGSHAAHPARMYVILQQSSLSDLMEAQAVYRSETGVFALDLDSLELRGWPGPSTGVTVEIIGADSHGFVAVTSHEWDKRTCRLDRRWDPVTSTASGLPICPGNER